MGQMGQTGETGHTVETGQMGQTGQTEQTDQTRQPDVQPLWRTSKLGRMTEDARKPREKSPPTE